MRRLSLGAGALALAVCVSGCTNPVVEAPPDASAADSGQACAVPCGSSCCGAGQVCDGATVTCVCKPSCDRRSCGPDGCGGSCGDCPPGTSCKDSEGTCYACLPQCDGKDCGPDGCGGECGRCGAGEVCEADGVCAVCTPDCWGRSCGSDGCGGSCGNCGAGTRCDEEVGTCVACQPACAGKQCGDDGCGGSCGSCGDGESCTSAGACISCAPQCAGKECGDNGCQGTCGSCAAGEVCDGAGRCVGCVPDCEGRECGGDGCGGSCGSCAGGESCDAPTGQCVGCVLDCEGKECGEDGCGGSCGGCTGGESCDAATGRCVGCEPDCEGRECGEDGCGGSCGGCTGGESCDAATGQCVGCEPDCEGKECGEDGCGGSCGTCPAGEACHAATGLCQPCTGSCNGKQCGDDGCGGSCGSCSGCNVCSAGGLCQPCTPDCSGRQCGDDGCGGLCGVCGAGTCAAGKCVICTAGARRCSASGAAVETCSADGTAWAASPCSSPGRCDPASKTCVAATCTPASRKCKDGFVVQECEADGSGWADRDCRTLDAFATADARCADGDCVDPCGDAARSGSSQGCEFWAAVTTNVQLGASFKGSVADGVQGDAVSDFALVFANPNAVQVTVKISRMKGGVEQAAPSSPAADASGAVYVPARGSLTVFLPWQAVQETGQQPWAYHVTASAPIAAYQFNPLDAYTGSAKQWDTYSQCTNCSFTSDASMLVPARSLTGTYVLAGREHQSITAATAGTCSEDADCPGPGNYCNLFYCAYGETYEIPAFFAVVAPEDGTQVTIRFAAATRAGLGGTPIAAQAAGSTATYTLDRYDVLQFWTDRGTAAATCTAFPSGSRWAQVCRYGSDLTGTVVTAVDAADVTRARAAPVASWVELRHEGNFLLTADQPVQLAQYLTAESANTAAAVEGDPSLILMAPVEQWRTEYGLLASPTLVHNYVTLTAPEGISSVTVDGKAVTAANFPGLVTANVGASVTVYRIPVAGGAHQVSASAPVGATVIGYDSYISYGYLGGTDLKRINASAP
jgi:hypothetical protein